MLAVSARVMMHAGSIGVRACYRDHVPLFLTVIASVTGERCFSSSTVSTVLVMV